MLQAAPNNQRGGNGTPASTPSSEHKVASAQFTETTLPPSSSTSSLNQFTQSQNPSKMITITPETMKLYAGMSPSNSVPMGKLPFANNNMIPFARHADHEEETWDDIEIPDDVFGNEYPDELDFGDNDAFDTGFPDQFQQTISGFELHEADIHSPSSVGSPVPNINTTNDSMAALSASPSNSNLSTIESIKLATLRNVRNSAAMVKSKSAADLPTEVHAGSPKESHATRSAPFGSGMKVDALKKEHQMLKRSSSAEIRSSRMSRKGSGMSGKSSSQPSPRASRPNSRKHSPKMMRVNRLQDDSVASPPASFHTPEPILQHCASSPSLTPMMMPSSNNASNLTLPTSTSQSSLQYSQHNIESFDDDFDIPRDFQIVSPITRNRPLVVSPSDPDMSFEDWASDFGDAASSTSFGGINLNSSIGSNAPPGLISRRCIASPTPSSNASILASESDDEMFDEIEFPDAMDNLVLATHKMGMYGHDSDRFNDFNGYENSRFAQYHEEDDMMADLVIPEDVKLDSERLHYRSTLSLAFGSAFDNKASSPSKLPRYVNQAATNISQQPLSPPPHHPHHSLSSPVPPPSRPSTATPKTHNHPKSLSSSTNSKPNSNAAQNSIHSRSKSTKPSTPTPPAIRHAHSRSTSSLSTTNPTPKAPTTPTPTDAKRPRRSLHQHTIASAAKVTPKLLKSLSSTSSLNNNSASSLASQRGIQQPRMIKKPKAVQDYGDGTELDMLDDLPVSREVESKFEKTPVNKRPTSTTPLSRKNKLATTTPPASSSPTSSSPSASSRGTNNIHPSPHMGHHFQRKDLNLVKREVRSSLPPRVSANAGSSPLRPSSATKSGSPRNSVSLAVAARDSRFGMVGARRSGMFFLTVYSLYELTNC